MRVAARNFKNVMQNIIIGIISVLVSIYLLVAMLRPEKF
jgi:K+-transporting ATPase KdpF subunit